jgi:Tfp pilus assembly protein PilX
MKSRRSDQSGIVLIVLLLIIALVILIVAFARAYQDRRSLGVNLPAQSLAFTDVPV